MMTKRLILNYQNNQKTYVEKINIYGNNVTTEEFIRSNLIVDEGDAFNKLLHTKSINNLRSKGIFDSVKSDINRGKNDSSEIIDIYIEENPLVKLVQALDMVQMVQHLVLV